MLRSDSERKSCRKNEAKNRYKPRFHDRTREPVTSSKRNEHYLLVAPSCLILGISRIWKSLKMGLWRSLMKIRKQPGRNLLKFSSSRKNFVLFNKRWSQMRTNLHSRLSYLCLHMPHNSNTDLDVDCKARMITTTSFSTGHTFPSHIWSSAEQRLIKLLTIFWQSILYYLWITIPCPALWLTWGVFWPSLIVINNAYETLNAKITILGYLAISNRTSPFAFSKTLEIITISLTAPPIKWLAAPVLEGPPRTAPSAWPHLFWFKTSLRTCYMCYMCVSALCIYLWIHILYTMHWAYTPHCTSQRASRDNNCIFGLTNFQDL